jgi:hypothetical protein
MSRASASFGADCAEGPEPEHTEKQSSARAKVRECMVVDVQRSA